MSYQRTLNVAATQTTKPELFVEFVEWFGGRAKTESRHMLRGDDNLTHISRRWISEGVVADGRKVTPPSDKPHAQR